ncbi:MAG: acetolactate synthase [Phycisphaerales bacterium]|nr:acetolactate synthase [Phycisphaerales bacterium]
MTRARLPYETLEGQGYAGVRQISVFLDNRVGQLLKLTKVVESKEVKILGISVIDSVDCSVVRLLFDDLDEAIEVLKNEGFAVSVAEVLIVSLPHGKRGLLSIFATLLSSEINVAYTYPLISANIGPTIALSVDNIEAAAETLRKQKFDVLSESDLKNQC